MKSITYGDNSRPLWSLIWRVRWPRRTFEALYGLAVAMQQIEERLEKVENNPMPPNEPSVHAEQTTLMGVPNDEQAAQTMA